MAAIRTITFRSFGSGSTLRIPVVIATEDVRVASMPNLSSLNKAIALIEKIELWREFAFGHKDFAPSAAPPATKHEPRSFELLHQVYEIYRGHSSGAIPEHVWARCSSVLWTLLSTVHFKAQWEAAKAEFPEDFRALMQGIRAS